MNDWISWLTQDTKTGFANGEFYGCIPYYQTSNNTPYSKDEYVSWASKRFRVAASNVETQENKKGDYTVKNSELKILNYFFINGKTTICWSDGTTTTCYAAPDKADAYTGFMIAIAKKFMGNKNQATNLADYWINKLPAKKKRIAEKAEKDRIEKERIENKRRKRREKYRLRIAAIRRKEEYEAAKLANEMFGVPLDFKNNDFKK